MRLISFTILIIILSSCSENPSIPKGLLEINKKVTCKNLIDNGYRWMPGEDVILIGKRTGDTLDYYQLEHRKSTLSQSAIMYSNQFSFIHYTQKAPDEFVPLDETPLICDNAYPFWRNMIIEIIATDTAAFVDKIDRNAYEIIPGESDCELYNAKVISKMTLDTFNLSILEEGERYYVSSSIIIER